MLCCPEVRSGKCVGNTLASDNDSGSAIMLAMHAATICMAAALCTTEHTQLHSHLASVLASNVSQSLHMQCCKFSTGVHNTLGVHTVGTPWTAALGRRTASAAINFNVKASTPASITFKGNEAELKRGANKAAVYLGAAAPPRALPDGAKKYPNDIDDPALKLAFQVLDKEALRCDDAAALKHVRENLQGMAVKVEWAVDGCEAFGHLLPVRCRSCARAGCGSACADWLRCCCPKCAQ